MSVFRRAVAVAVAVLGLRVPAAVAESPLAQFTQPPGSPSSASVPCDLGSTAATPSRQTTHRSLPPLATRFHSTRSRAPSRSSRREILEERQLLSVADALRELPGLQVVRTGGPGGTTSLFTRGTNANHTLVLVDGVPVADPSNFTGAVDLADSEHRCRGARRGAAWPREQPLRLRCARGRGEHRHSRGEGPAQAQSPPRGRLAFHLPRSGQCLWQRRPGDVLHDGQSPRLRWDLACRCFYLCRFAEREL